MTTTTVSEATADTTLSTTTKRAVTTATKPATKERTEYRTVKKLTKRSSVKLSDPSWSLESTENIKGDWQIRTSTTKPIENADCEILELIQSPQKIVGYTLKYCLYQVNYEPWYRIYFPNSQAHRLGSDLRKTYGEHNSDIDGTTKMISVAEFNSLKRVESGERVVNITYGGYNGATEPAYVYGDRLYFATPNYSIPEPPVYRYRIRTNQTVYTYSSTVYGNWSQTYPVTDSDTTVETRKVRVT